MASPNVDSLLPQLLPNLAECPLDTIRSAIRRAARRFCRESTAWRVLLDTPITLATDTRTYALTLPADTDVVLITNVYAEQGELTGKSLDMLAEALPNWPVAQGSPRYFNSFDYNSLSLYPKPTAVDAGATLLVRASLVPKLTIADLPALLTDRHDEALVAGALASLYGIPERPWSRPQSVDGLAERFNQLAAAARILVEHERVRGSITMRRRPFGA